MVKRSKTYWKKGLSLFLVLMLLVSVSPVALAEDFGEGGFMGSGTSNSKAEKNYEQAVITQVTAITDIKTERNANDLNYYVVGATVTGTYNGKAVTEQEFEGLVTVLDSSGKEIAPVISDKGEVSYPGIEGDSEAVVVITDYLHDAENGTLVAMGTESSSPDLAYRAALYVRDGEVNENSITQAIGEGALTGTDLTGATIQGESSGFSAVVVKTTDDAKTASEVTISGSTITLDSQSDGSDVNDFAGYGAAVSSFGKKTLTVIEDSTVSTVGAGKSAIFTDSGADLVVKSSILSSAGGELYEDYELTSATNKMVAPPWVLGVAGNARTSNLMGKGSTATFVDSTVTADNWGALSVDSGSSIVMTTVNTNVETTKVDGDESAVNGAYGAFGIGSTMEYMYGLDMKADNYAWVMLGATVNLLSSETDKTYVIENSSGEKVTEVTSTQEGRDTTIETGNFGFMMSAFGGATNTVNVGENTTIHTDNAVFLYKDGSAVISIDKADVSSNNGVLFQAIDNEDSIIGDMTKGFSEPEGWSSTWYAGESYQGDFSSSGKTANITINDSTLAGDIYNGTGYFYTAGSIFAGEGIFGSHTVNVSLTGSTKYSGVIASTEIQHGDWTDKEKGTFTTNKSITFRDSEADPYVVARATEGAMKLGHVVNQNYFNGYNQVNVTVENGAAWTVTGDSLVYNLTANSSDITATAPVTITVKGTLTLDGKAVSGETTVGNVTYVVDPDVYVVEKGDSLWEIAKATMGSGYEWTAIYEANKAIIKNPNILYKGQKLIIP